MKWVNGNEVGKVKGGGRMTCLSTLGVQVQAVALQTRGNRNRGNEMFFSEYPVNQVLDEVLWVTWE